MGQGETVIKTADQQEFDICATSPGRQGSSKGADDTYRSSSFLIISTTSSGSFCMFFLLRSMVRPGFKSVLTPLVSPACWSLSRRASRMASLARAMTCCGESPAPLRLDVEAMPRSAGPDPEFGGGGGGGGGGGAPPAPATDCVPRRGAGFSGSPRRPAWLPSPGIEGGPVDRSNFSCHSIATDDNDYDSMGSMRRQRFAGRDTM